MGKGPLSQYANSDVFFDNDNALALGLFGGIALRLGSSLRAVLEYDGRDGNVGLQYDHRYVGFKLAFTHVEQLRSSAEIKPRVALGLVIRSAAPTAEKRGHISGRILDAYSGDPVPASISVPDARSLVDSDGNYTFALPPGTYRLQVTSEGYFTKQFKVTVRPEQDTELNVPLLNIARSESLSLHLGEAERLAEEGDIRSARDEYAAVLKIYPEHQLSSARVRELDEQMAQIMSLHRSRALEYQESGRFEQALSEWTELLRLKPGDPEALGAVEDLRARAKRQAEQRPQAPVKTERKTAPPRKPKETPKLTTEEVEILYDQALVHYFNEEYEKALELFKRILKDYPDHQKAKKYLDRTQRILGL